MPRVAQDKPYWIRNEQGSTWGPFSLVALDRLRGQLTERAEASNDGKTFRPGSEFPELKALLSAPRQTPRPSPVPRSPALADLGSRSVPRAAAQGEHERPATTVTVDAPVEPERPLEVPLEGDLAQFSPVRLYALCALTSASGWLTLELESGRMLTISFRRGTPEQLSSDDHELSLLRFLQDRQIVSVQQAMQADEHAKKSGVDMVSALFQLQLIPPADAHRLLGDYALFLLDQALASWRGRFTFEADAPSPPGAFPLGQRWALLAESVRRLEVPTLRARLSKRLSRPVLRSGGLSVGQVEQLALNAQEARLYAGIDGTRTGEELLKTLDPAVALRMLYLLTELGHLSLGEGLIDSPAPTPIDVKPAAAKAPDPAAAPTKPQTPAPAERPAPPRTVRTQVAPPPRPPPPVLKAQTPAVKADPTPTPLAVKAMAPVPSPGAVKPTTPLPVFATGPAGETPSAQMKRLQVLRAKMTAGTHFEALGLERKTFSMAEVKRNFFALAKELHPDTVTDASLTELRSLKESLFALINEATQVLMDQARRKEYEKELDGKADNVDVSRIFAAEENFQRAEIMIKARKYKEGLELLDAAIKLNDQEAEFYAWRGYARFLLAKDRKAAFDECANDCKHAIKMIEKCLPAHLFLGNMAKVIGELKLAEKSFQRVLMIDPKNVEAQRELRLMGKK